MSEPTRRDKLRPMEYVMLSGLLALFAGLVVLMVTRDFLWMFMAAGVAFVIITITIAMLMLAVAPNQTPEGQKSSPDTGND